MIFSFDDLDASMSHSLVISKNKKAILINGIEIYYRKRSSSARLFTLLKILDVRNCIECGDAITHVSYRSGEGMLFHTKRSYLTLGHIKPASGDGDKSLCNLQPECFICNQEKKNYFAYCNSMDSYIEDHVNKVKSYLSS